MCDSIVRSVWRRRKCWWHCKLCSLWSVRTSKPFWVLTSPRNYYWRRFCKLWLTNRRYRAKEWEKLQRTKRKGKATPTQWNDHWKRCYKLWYTHSQYWGREWWTKNQFTKKKGKGKATYTIVRNSIESKKKGIHIKI